MIKVTLFPPQGEKREIEFEKSSIMFGKAIGNDVVIDVDGVSRYHGRIVEDEGELFVEDLGSTNGTYLGTERLQRARLSPDDRVTIGSAIIQAQLIAVTETLTNQPALSSPPAESSVSVVEQTLPESAVVEVEAEESLAQKSESFYWQSMKSFLAPIWPYLMDDGVSEIMINGPEEIFIERKGHLERMDLKFSPDALYAAVLNIAQYVGRRVDENEPYLDARLPDGSRVAVLLPPCGRKGISIAIRKFGKERLTLDKLIQFGAISAEMVTFLRAAVILKKNIIVSGGTSSGKTSLLNVISCLIPEDERILTIEDSAELQLAQPHVLPMETKPPDKKGRGQVTIRDLVRASLRMRPDRIIVGEIRAGEAIDLLQAMNTGHSGSMATVHASSPAQSLTRLETLALFSGLEIPARALREQVSSAVDIVIQAARLPDKSRKVTHITEIAPLTQDGSYVTHDIYRFVREGMAPDGKIIGAHQWMGYVPSFMEEMELSGLTEAVALMRREKPKVEMRGH